MLRRRRLLEGLVRERGSLTVDEYGALVCTCSEERHLAPDAPPSSPPDYISYRRTVGVVRSVEPTESGSYFYRCDRCGASGWSGI